MSERAKLQRRIGKEAAIALGATKWWESKTPRQIAEFQMATCEMCCPFSVFHEAVEKTLDRPVFTHEFGLNFDGIWDEIFNGNPAPTMDEILNLIPEEKRIVVEI